jgi:hypothetical protein
MRVKQKENSHGESKRLGIRRELMRGRAIAEYTEWMATIILKYDLH